MPIHLLLLALLSTPVAEPVVDAATVAPPAAVAVDAAPAAAPPAEEKLQCRRERILGSNRTQRVCTSAAQRERERNAARDALESAQRDR